MRYWTLEEIKTKVEADLDIEDEVFIRPTELLTYINEAIDECEGEIHTLYEDYFLKYVDVAVTNGLTSLSIPTYIPDIYADKIRRLVFTLNGGTQTYTVERLRDSNKFEQKAIYDANATTDLYKYMLVNQTPGNPQIIFTPQIRESGNITIWYLRNANRLSVNTDVCDIPEFINFIFAHIKLSVYSKEGHPNMSSQQQKLEMERQRMASTLSNRVPDDDNTIEADTSAYEDMN